MKKLNKLLKFKALKFMAVMIINQNYIFNETFPYGWKQGMKTKCVHIKIQVSKGLVVQ